MGIARGGFSPNLVADIPRRHEAIPMPIANRRERHLDEYPGKQAMPAYFIHFNDNVVGAVDCDDMTARVDMVGRSVVAKDKP